MKLFRKLAILPLSLMALATLSIAAKDPVSSGHSLKIISPEPMTNLLTVAQSLSTPVINLPALPSSFFSKAQDPKGLLNYIAHQLKQGEMPEALCYANLSDEQLGMLASVIN